MPRQVTHVCTQETKIALLQKGQEYTNEKLDSIHESVSELNHKLLGNGTPGLIAKQDDKIVALEKKFVAYGTVVAIIMILLNLFGSRLVTAFLG